MKCEKCGGEIEWGDRFCRSCGAPTHLPQFCPECGARVPDGQDACPACGTLLEGASPAEEAEQSAGPSAEAAADRDAEEAGAAEAAGVSVGAAVEDAEPAADAADASADGADVAPAAPEAPKDIAAPGEPGSADADEDLIVEEVADAEPVEVVENGAHAFWDDPAVDAPDASAEDAEDEKTQVPPAEEGARDVASDAPGEAAAEPDAGAPESASGALGPDAGAAFDPLSEDSTRAYIDAILAQEEREISQGRHPVFDARLQGEDEGSEQELFPQPAGTGPAGDADEAAPGDSTAVLSEAEDDGSAKTMELPLSVDEGPSSTMRLPLEGSVRKRGPRVSLLEIDLPEIPRPSLPRLDDLLGKVPRVAGLPHYAVPAAVAGALVVVVVGAAALTGGFGLASQQGSPVALATLGSSATQGTDAQAAEPEVRATVNDYSWSELSQISALIAQAPTDADGLDIAARYNLCAADGTLDGSQTKTVALADGTEAAVQVAGFRHDDRADGQGKAGITFVFTEAVAARAYNENNSNAGGWDQSELRTWVNTSLVSQLPSELQSALLAVSKATNNAGYASDPTAVSTTSDQLWLLSLAEVGGTQDPTSGSSAVVYNAEGSRYQLFSDAEAAGTLDALLVRGQVGETGALSWWMRSPYPNDDYCAMSVNDDGSLTYYRGTYRELGVVPGFCL